jgi:hypothetical protein
MKKDSFLSVFHNAQHLLDAERNIQAIKREMVDLKENKNEEN